MIEFRAFGSTSLQGEEGNELLSVLARPKLLSLLAALGLVEGGGFVRREWVVGLLWTDSDPDRARATLRQSLYRLRQALGPRCVETRGEDELRMDPSVVWCDVQAFENALLEGRLEDALALYRGDLLEGFFPPEAPEFERWLEQRRADLRRSAAEAALAAAERAMEKGNHAAAGHWAREGAEHAGTDEPIIRRCIVLLGEVGDRGGAMELYRGLEERLAVEFGTTPSEKTQEVLTGIRPAGGDVDEDPASEPEPVQEHFSGLPEVESGEAATESAPAPARPGPFLLRPRTLPYMLAAALVVVVLLSPWPSGDSFDSGVEIRGGGSGMGVGTPQRAVLPRSQLAVLPLRVTHDDSGLKDLSKRLYEDIVSQLSGISGISLILPPAGDVPWELQGDPVKLGRLLGAGSILEGTLERSPEGIRVSARLLATFPELEIFSDSYEGTISNFSALHEDVVQELAVALVGAISPREREGLALPFPRSVEAYRPFLRAQGIAGPDATPSDLMVEERLLKQSLSHDPEFPEAWAALARNYIRQEGTSRDAELVADSALVAAQTALSLNPLSPSAHLAMGWVYQERGFLDRSLESLARAIQLEPTQAEAHYLQGRAHFALGRFAEAIQDFRTAISLDPDARYARVLMALTYASVDDLGTAARLVREEVESMKTSPAEEALLQAALEMWRQDPEAAFQTGMEMVETAPDVPNLRTYLADLALQAGRCQVAAEEARTALAMSPDPERLRYLFFASTILGGALQRCGDPEEAVAYLEESKEKLLRQVESGQENPSIYLELSAVSDALGDRRTAVVWLTRAYQLGYRRAALLKSHPLLSGLRQDEAVQRLLAQMESDVAQMRETVEANTPPPL